jgi:endonuclease/exonuclease/phosphatase (EEP) superfamily protein YafD
VPDAGEVDERRVLRLLISNVLMENQQSTDFLKLVAETNPDLIFAVETNDRWDRDLGSLDRDYPHTVKHPQGNHYGMHLFSRLELENVRLRFLVDEDVPSLRVTVKLRSGERIEFFGLHPRPPDPGHDTDERDAEILIVGREVRECTRPAVVAGDLNDVAWSDTTRLFQTLSGLLDPRRGRGMFNTFHSRYPVFRWPLDHVFHDRRFALVRLQRLRSIGSDHFPVLTELQLGSGGGAEAVEAPDGDVLEEVDDRIAAGHAAQAAAE